MINFNNAGYVYVLTNEAQSGIVKIGYTKNDPQTRANQLDGTGLIHPWRVYGFEFVENAEYIEEACHVHLFKQRVNMDREFFAIDPISALELIRRKRDEYREQTLFVKNNINTPKYLTKEYDNQKLADFVSILIENKGKKNLTITDISKQLKMTEKGVGSLIYILEKQPMKILYTPKEHITKKENKEYNLYLKFSINQLIQLEKIYPKLDFSKSKQKLSKKESLFEKKENPLLEHKESIIFNNIVVFLKDKMDIYLEEKNKNSENENFKYTKRYYTIKELSLELNIKENLLKHVVSICENDHLLENVFHTINDRIGFDFSFYKEDIFKDIMKRETNLSNLIKENMEKKEDIKKDIEEDIKKDVEIKKKKYFSKRKTKP